MPLLACREGEALSVRSVSVPHPRPESLHHAGRESGKGMGLMGVTERVG